MAHPKFRQSYRVAKKTLNVNNEVNIRVSGVLKPAENDENNKNA